MQRVALVLGVLAGLALEQPAPCSPQRHAHLPAAPPPWRSPFLPTLPAWLGMPSDGLPPAHREWALYRISGNRSHLSLWSTVAQQEAYERYWSPLARAAVLSGTDAARDAASLQRWASAAASAAPASAADLADLLTLGCVSNARFLAHALEMTRSYRCTDAEAARFLLLQGLTAAPLSVLVAAVALGSAQRGAAAALALAALPLLLSAAPLDFAAALEDPRRVAAAAGVGVAAALLSLW
jgi:hypothetical protein